MEEYIKREDALDAVLFALSGTGYQSRAITAIRNVPTATTKVDMTMDILRTLEKAIYKKKSPFKTYISIGGRAMGNSVDYGKELAYYEVLKLIDEIRIKLLEEEK
jgi:hypothetical protein